MSMRVWRTAAVVFLFASVLGNVLLIARGVGRAASDDRRSAALPQEQTRAHAELVAERERIAVLRERIRELESRAAVPAPNSTSPVESRSSLYRDRFRRSIPLVGAGSSYAAPESYLPVYEAHLELFRASVRRPKDPTDYAECLRELFDAVLEDGTLKLGAEQSKELRRILDDYRESLLQASSASVAERNVRDLETEASMMSRARTLLNQEQFGRVRDVLSTLGVFVEAMEYTGLNHDFTEDSFVPTWTESYKFDETQKPAVQVAARGYAEALRELELRYRGREDRQGVGTAEGYEFRLRSLQAQLSALKTLENVMTPDQKQRLNSQLLTEFYFVRPRQPEK